MSKKKKAARKKRRDLFKKKKRAPEWSEDDYSEYVNGMYDEEPEYTAEPEYAVHTLPFPS